MRTQTQRMDALIKANVVRTQAARWKRDTAKLPPCKGALRVAAVLRDPAPPLDAIPIEAMLLCVKRVGEKRAFALLDRVGVRSGRRKVRDLTDRQRHVLADELERLRTAESVLYESTDPDSVWRAA